jgi:hypothetical protein
MVAEQIKRVDGSERQLGNNANKTYSEETRERKARTTASFHLGQWMTVTPLTQF